MKTSSKDCISFVTMTVLMFIGINLPFLMGGVSSGPNVDSFLGMTGWLWLHRGSEGVSIERVYLLRLPIEIGLAVFLTWILSRTLHGSRTSG